MLPLPSDDKKVSSFLVFYIIISTQIGIGILSFQRYLAKEAGQDAWISIIISAVSIHIILWMLYQILNKGNNDIFAIHKDLFGKWIGGLLSLALVAYMVLATVTVIRRYIEVVQVWMFYQMSTWYITFILAVLIYVYVIGGFRVIVGLCFFSFFILIPLLSLNIFALEQPQFSYLFPIMEHSASDLLAGSKVMSLYFSGFETILFFYPFIKNAPSSQKWAQLGIAVSTFFYLFSALICFVYFSFNQLEQTIWPQVTLWKIVDFPFLERFEYAGITAWLFIILPNLCIYMWAATRGVKQLFSMKQKYSLVLFLSIVIVATPFFKERAQLYSLIDFIGVVAMYVIYAYIPFLFFYQLIRNKLRGTS
ncbi:GerAB/ArcD/ProY family transporter [Bacillus sp. B190/17]|uniref:GerAB/ArcD/ProY family transporter n=1 Tax=Bacillus lumedeiriae TaxID=3058829 RepID=A0ABW8IAI1_9BACI